MTRPDYAQEIRRTLTDPRKLCESLGLAKGAKRAKAGSVMICCPVHADRTPSCHVSVGPDGTLRAKCYSCDFTGDALTLVAVAHDLDTRDRDEFKAVLLEAAHIAGLYQVVEELNGDADYTPRELPPAPEPAPEPEYPPTEEVDRLWSSAIDADMDSQWCKVAVARRIDPERVTGLGLAKALERGSWCPQWASVKPRRENAPPIRWSDCGYRLIVRVYDSSGIMRSVRAWQIDGRNGPKRLPARGCRSTDLIMANDHALAMLRGDKTDRRVLITEGEPDWIAGCIEWPDHAVFGVYNGSWSGCFASRIPTDATVIVATDHDIAGNKYAAEIIESLKDRCAVWRLRSG